MAESIVQINEGSGKKLHTFQKVIGANTVEDEIVVLGEPYVASYNAAINNISGATGPAHVIQIMAGATNKLRIRHIRLKLTTATAAGMLRIGVKRLTTAGTGGGVVTPTQLDPADAAPGGTAMTLPTVLGTVAGDYFWIASFSTAVAAPQIHAEQVWPPVSQPHVKPLVIAAGVANGIALVVVSAIAGSIVDGDIQWDETSF